ncbi:TPA: ABC transporter permease [Streptococcus suis]|nr:ABC transporter permease [Streptococcus suis]HEL1584474.1 ABC transporter permease [Streptococcus suis]HEL1640260.1 ABC transporter permease [Streptococcus suis]
MFGKLLKHEFKSVGKWYFGLYALSLIISFLLGLWIKTIDIRTDFSSDSEAIMLAVSVFAYAIIIISVAIATFLLIANRFRKNIYGRQGYLTMTLPVSTHQIILSKLVAALIWNILAAVVIILSIFLTISVSGVDEFYSFFYSVEFIEFLREYPQYFLHQIVEWIVSVLLIYFSISVGHLFKSYRILMAVITYFVINFIVGSVTAVFYYTNLMHMDYYTDPTSMVLPSPVVTIMTILLGVAYYFGTHYIMTKKLNLQ